MIANEHLLSSEEISSLSTGSVGGASVGSDGVREVGLSAGTAESAEQREESPASTRSEQEHYETPMVCEIATSPRLSRHISLPLSLPLSLSLYLSHSLSHSHSLTHSLSLCP